MSVRVERITGDVGPSVLPKHWNYRPFERREYSDGLVIVLEESPEHGISGVPIKGPPVIKATVWIKADGMSGGWHRRVIRSPADIGALYAGFRRGLATLGLYPLYTPQGWRRHLGYPDGSSLTRKEADEAARRVIRWLWAA